MQWIMQWTMHEHHAAQHLLFEDLRSFLSCLVIALNYLGAGTINPVQPKAGRTFPGRSLPSDGDSFDWQNFEQKVQSNADKILKQVGVNLTMMYGTAKQQLDKVLDSLWKRD